MQGGACLIFFSAWTNIGHAPRLQQAAGVFFFSSKELLGELVSLMDIERIQFLSCVKRNVAFHQGRHKL